METPRRVSSHGQMMNALESRDAKSCVSTEKSANFEHASAANQTIKFLEGIRIDPFVRSVMKARIVAPMMTGRSRSHMSIALELGARMEDVIAAEQYGIQLVGEMLASTDVQEMINKYNRDKMIDGAVKQFGNSGVQLTAESDKGTEENG